MILNNDISVSSLDRIVCKLMRAKFTSLLFCVAVWNPYLYAEVEIRWRIPDTTINTKDVPVIALDIRDMGIGPHEKRDLTSDFQKAIDRLYRHGGGVLYVSSGHYPIKGHLDLKSGVMIRGEMKPVDPEANVQGTVLLAYADRGKMDGEPFINMQLSSGLKNLAIWYPEQRHDDIVPYPFTLQHARGEHMNLENVGLINAYNGILIGKPYNQLHYFNGLWGTTLNRGIDMDLTSDIGRLENIHFSPRFWSNSGLKGAPSGNDEFRIWMKKNSIAFYLRRSDWPYVYNFKVDGYKTGLHVTKGSTMTLPNGQFYKVDIRDCDVAMDVHHVSDWGMSLTDSFFSGNRHAVMVRPSSRGVLLFHDCVFESNLENIISSGAGHLSFQHCRFNNTVSVEKASINVLDSDFTAVQKHFKLGARISAGVILGNRFKGKPDLDIHTGSRYLVIDHEQQVFKKLPAVRYLSSSPYQVKRRKLYLASNAKWDVKGDGISDDAPSIQKMLDRAATDGGGIVFIPAGRYALKSRLIIPSHVELRGVLDMPHHGRQEGSVFFVDHGKGKDNGPATITLHSDAGMRGFNFHYPKQRVSEIVKYPYLIAGRGDRIYLVNLTADNPYQYVDLFSHPCHDHYIDYVAGGPLVKGIVVGGGSRNGYVKNCQFNSHYWIRENYDNSPGGEVHKHPEGKALWYYKMDHLDSFVAGATENQTWFNNFAFENHHGFRAVVQDGKGPNGIVFGQGIDAAQTSIRIDAVGKKGLTFINTELTCFETPKKKNYFYLDKALHREVVFLNTTVWGGHDRFAEIHGGQLTLQQMTCKRIFEGDGSGFEVNRGSLNLVNCFFNEPGDIIIPGKNMGIVNTKGNIFYQGLEPGLDLNRIAYKTSTLKGRKDILDQYNSKFQEFLPRGMKEIYTLGSLPPDNHGITLIEQDYETTLEPIVMEGKTGWKSNSSQFDDVRAVYFDVTYDPFVSGQSSHVEITIQYYDNAERNAQLVYDSSDQSITKADNHPGAWKSAGKLDFKGSKSWKKTSFVVTDAYFHNRCNGKDIRLNAFSSDPLIVGGLWIKKLDK